MSTLDINDTHLKLVPKHSTFKFCVFRPGAKCSSYHIRTKNWSQRNVLCIIKIWKVYLASNQCDEQNPKKNSKSKEIKFLAKFAQGMKFHENRGNFELKINIRDVIKSIMHIRNIIFELKTLPSPILVNHAPPQTDGTEIR